MDKLTHISNLFYNQPSISAGEKLLKVSGMDKVFFTNSGTEAIEGALKIAKRYHYNKLHETMGDGCDGCEEKEVDMTGEIIAMNHSFHGRRKGTDYRQDLRYHYGDYPGRRRNLSCNRRILKGRARSLR